VKQVEDILRKVDEEIRSDDAWKPKILAPIEIFGLDKFGDYAMRVGARVKTRPSQQWAVGREYNRRIKAAFDASGISIPYPTTISMTRGIADGGVARG
jgi:small conductance mechanosensitive channel